MYLELELDKYNLPNTYIRDGKECFFDPIRQKLILKTPEEIVRQRFVEFLIHEMKVPKNRIELEVPMSYFKKGASGRADIIVYEKDEENVLIPVLVIECKAEDVCLTDNAFEQVSYYDTILLADNIIVTNGKKLHMQSWDEKRKKYSGLLDLPKYQDLVKKVNIQFDTTEQCLWQRPLFNQNHSKDVINTFLDYGWLGEGTEMKLIPFIINLASFIQDETQKIPPQKVTDKIKIIEDGGYRFTSFGNAAGGTWDGEYRYFIVEDQYKNNQIISVSVMGSLKCTNHPQFGNRKGHTALIVAIDDFEISHNSLQLNLDKYTQNEGNHFNIWHDGTLTLGKLGAVKRVEVIDYIKANDPDLIINDKIHLGYFDNSKEINMRQQSSQDFVKRLIRYALIRDQFRKHKNSTL